MDLGSINNVYLKFEFNSKSKNIKYQINDYCQFNIDKIFALMLYYFKTI